MLTIKVKIVILFGITVILILAVFFLLLPSTPIIYRQLVPVRNEQNTRVITYNVLKDKDCSRIRPLVTLNPTLLVDNNPTKEKQKHLEADTLKKYFPIFNNEDIRNFKMSDRSIYSTALLFDGEKTAKLIKQILQECFPTTSYFTILDACSNVGGNALWFARYFSRVTAVEIDKNECSRLTQNLIHVYKFPNVDVYCDNTLRILSQPNVKWNAIFFDPPWGGPCYKEIGKLILGLDGFNVCDIIDWCLDQSIADCVVLRHPINADTTTRNKKLKTVSFTRKKSMRMLYQLSFWIHPSLKLNIRTMGNIVADQIIVPDITW